LCCALAAAALLVLGAPTAWADLGDDEVDLTVESGGREFTNSIGMKFVPVRKGKFLMGSPADEKQRQDEEHQHPVEISRDFYLGAHEVTQRQWKALMGNNPSFFCKEGGHKDRVQGLDTSDFPVDNVSWEDAQKFIEKLNARDKRRSGWRYALPTDAQWEYACRGGPDSTTKPFRFAKGQDSLSSDDANFNGAPYGNAKQGKNLNRTAKVGSYKPNNLGLYDMHGNLWEWCQDWYSVDYVKKSPLRDPPGPAKGTERMLRSACHFNGGWECRAARRHGQASTFKNEAVGFRVAFVPIN
jgi:formylglycine-generating enzyme required for sulfatase activity